MFTWIEAHPGLAAWVQAVGTIAAIGFAVWLPNHERRTLEKTAAVAARSPLTAAMVALTQAWNFLRSQSASAEARQRIADKLELARHGLEAFAIQSLSPRAALAFQEVRDAFYLAVHGFSDPGMRPLGNMHLRCEFLQFVQKLTENAPGLFDEHSKAGLARAIRETTAEIDARTSRGEKPDDYGL